jgi:hypothetical protein
LIRHIIFQLPVFAAPRFCSIDGYQFSLNTVSSFLHILAIYFILHSEGICLFLNDWAITRVSSFRETICLGGKIFSN